MRGGGDYRKSTVAVLLEFGVEDGDGGEEAEDGEEDGDGAGGTNGHGRVVVSEIMALFARETWGRREKRPSLFSYGPRVSTRGNKKKTRSSFPPELTCGLAQLGARR